MAAMPGAITLMTSIGLDLLTVLGAIRHNRLKESNIWIGVRNFLIPRFVTTRLQIAGNACLPRLNSGFDDQDLVHDGWQQEKMATPTGYMEHQRHSSLQLA